MTPIPTAPVNSATFLDQCAASNQLASLILELLDEAPEDGVWSPEKVPDRATLDAQFRKAGVSQTTSANPNPRVLGIFLPSISIEWLQGSWELDAIHEAWGTVEAFSMEHATAPRTVVTQVVCGDGFAFRLTMIFEIDTISHTALIEWTEGPQDDVESQVVAWCSEHQQAVTEEAMSVIASLPKHTHLQTVTDIGKRLALPTTVDKDPLDAIEQHARQCDPDGRPLLEPNEQQIILGVLDRARSRAGRKLPDLPEVDGLFWNLRQMIRESEFPSEDTNPERLYLSLAPFDIGIKREAEGVVVDIWGDEVGLDSLASTYAFYSEAKADEEDAAA